MLAAEWVLETATDESGGVGGRSVTDRLCQKAPRLSFVVRFSSFVICRLSVASSVGQGQTDVSSMGNNPPPPVTLRPK